ncbi:MAG: SOS response-associated peptidase family protein [Steroidobacteraceae bacterium]
MAGCGKIGKNRLRASGFATFAVITTDANELVAEIHDRIPLILAAMA